MNVVDIAINAVDNASKVMENVGGAGEKAGKTLSANWVKVGAATAVAGVALEAVARKQAVLTESTKKLAASLDMQEGEVRNLALELSNVTFPLENVIGLMEIGRQQGLKSAEQLKEFANFWDMISDATGESSTMLGEAGIALKAVGVAAGEEGEALAAFGYISQETTSEISEFLRFVSRTGPELREMGADVNDAAAILGILEHEFGMTARVAQMEFKMAVSSADGDMQKMLGTLGISNEMMTTYKQTVADSSDVIARNAAINAESFTVMQKLQHWVSELTYKYGNLIQGLSALTPILIMMGPLIKIITVAKTIWGNVSLAVAAKINILSGSVLGLKGSILTAIPLIGELAMGLGLLGLMNYQTNKAFGDLDLAIEKTSGLQQQLAEDSTLFPNVDYVDRVGQAITRMGDLSNISQKSVDDIENLINVYLEGKISADMLQRGLDGLVLVSKDAASETDKLSIVQQMNNDIIKNLMDQYGKTEEEAREFAESQGMLQDETEEVAEGFEDEAEAADKASEALEKQREKVDALLESMFELYNINQSVTEATWAYEDAQAELLKMESEGITSGREYEKQLFNIQDAREGVIRSIQDEFFAEGTSLERKEELRSAYIKLALDAVKNGEISSQAYRDMLAEFDTTAKGIETDIIGGGTGGGAGIIPNIRGASSEIDLAIRDKINPALLSFGSQMDTTAAASGTFKDKLLEVWGAIGSGIKTAINSVLGFINGLIGGIEKGINSAASALNSFKFTIPDWIPKIGGESFSLKIASVSLPRIPLLAAGGRIKQPGYVIVGDEGPELLHLPRGAEVRPSTEPVLIQNIFEIAELIVREEADIQKIAKNLLSLQRSKQRGLGYK